MFWNHRIRKAVNEEYGITYYDIVECYYDDDGNIIGWDEKSLAPSGNNKEELKTELEQMLGAFDRPVIDEKKELPKAEKRMHMMIEESINEK